MVRGTSPQTLNRPQLASGQVRLRAVTGADLEALRVAEIEESFGYQWRLGGETPSPEQWSRSQSATLAQFLVVNVEANAPVGVVALYDVNFRNGYGYIAAGRFDVADRSLVVLGATLLFINYVFQTWPLRKIYFEVAEYNVDQFESGIGEHLVSEARFSNHIFLGGRYWDQLVLSLTRERWVENVGSGGLARFGVADG